MDPTFTGEAEASCCYATVSSSPPKRRAGRTKFHETRHPVFKGVRQRGRKGRWVCELREPNKKSRLWLGTYPTAEMAARAHDVAAMALRGRSACLNFADSASLLPIPDASAGTRAIQRAAAAAARAFHPPVVPSPPNTPSGSTITTETTLPTTPLSMKEFSDACSMMELDLDLRMLGYDYFSMAEELPADLTPPAAAGSCWDDAVGGADLPLWSYSV